jgi:hypothetical protein
MTFLGLDTHPKAAAVQLDLLRRSSVERRGALARSLSSTVIELSRRALRDTMKSASDAEVLNRWVALSYGEDLASRIRSYVEARTR